MLDYHFYRNYRYTVAMLNKEQKNSPEILSVSQLNKNAKFSLEKKFNDVWV